MKSATTDLINAHPNATYALARFHSQPVLFSCQGGGWNGPNVGCLGAPLGQGDNAADILVGFAPGNETDLLEWMDFQDNHVDVAPSSGCSLCDDCGGGCDKELRATGATVNAGALFSANTYLDSVRSADPLRHCRKSAVIFVSDGQNGCLDPLNQFDPDPTPEQAAAICADGVPVYVIGFSSPTIVDVLNQFAAAGCGPGCDQTGCDGQAILVDSRAALEAAMGPIVDAQDVGACAENGATCTTDCCDSDGACDPGETACCAADACSNACGDGCCTGLEDALGCAADCG